MKSLHLKTLTLILFSTLSIQASEPKWFENKTPSSYPVSDYVLGFGSGASSQEALTQAQSEIAAQLTTTIKTTTSISEIETQNSSSITTQTKHESTLSSVVLANLQGISIVKREKKDGTVYILAVLSKKEFLISLSKKLDSLKQTIETKNQKVKTEDLKHHVQTVLNLYDDLMPLCQNYYDNFTLYNALSPTKITTQIPTEESIKTLRKEVLSNLKIGIKSGNYQTGEPAKMLENPIVFEVSYKNSALENTRLSIRYSDGSLITEDKTDSEGTLSIPLLAIPFPLQKTYIEAVLPLSNLSPDETESLTTRAYYTLAFSQLTTLKLIPIKDPSDSALSGLFNLLESYGVTWSTESPFIIEAEIEDDSISSLSGAVIPQYIATITWTLRIRLQNGESLGTIRVRGKSINKDREKAHSEAYQKLDLTKTSFYEFLSKFAKVKAGS